MIAPQFCSTFTISNFPSLSGTRPPLPGVIPVPVNAVEIIVHVAQRDGQSVIQFFEKALVN
jgi:hypothetical protein